MNKSESIKELATALCKFQAEVEKVKKTATNPFFKSKYATLSDILEVIKKPLSKNGLSFVQLPLSGHVLETILMHSSGEFISSSYEMTPVKNDPQGLGSVITYQRRYALGAILGLDIDIDDDANSASEQPKAEQPKAEQPKAEPAKQPAKQPVKKTVQPTSNEKKEVLTPTHPGWSKVVTYLQNGGFMSKVEQKYIISKEVEHLLINLIDQPNGESTNDN